MIANYYLFLNNMYICDTMKRSLISILLVFQAFLAIAGNNIDPLDGYVFESLDVYSGTLSNDSPRCVVIDDDGYVWIGTRIGLNRYDGTRTRVFLKDETGLESDFIYSLYVASDGCVWVGTMNGIAKYDKQTDSFIIPLDSDGSPIKGCVNSITGDKDGVIWFDNYGPDLYSYDPREGYVRRHALGMTDSRKRLAFDIEGRLIVCSSCDDIYVMEADSLRRIQVNGAVSTFKGDELWGPVPSLLNKDLFYIADKRIGICEVDISNGSVRILYAFQSDQKPTSLLYYGEGMLMSTTTDGLVICDIWDKEEVRVIRSDYAGTKFEYLICAAVGKDGDLWIGTRNNGVLYNRPDQNRFSKAVRLDEGPLLSAIEMNACCEDSDGVVWIATLNSGLLRYDSHKNSVKKYHVPGLPKSLTDVCRVGSSLFVGTRSGLYRIKNDRIVSYYRLWEEDNTIDNKVCDIMYTRSGALYVSTTSCVLLYNAPEDSFSVVQGTENRTIQRMYEDYDGDIWMDSYSSGVYCLELSKGGNLVSYEGRSPSQTHSLLIDRDGGVWSVGQGSDLYKLDDSKDVFVPIMSSSFLPYKMSDFVSGVQDSAGNLWISTSSGLLCYDVVSGNGRMFKAKDGIHGTGLSRGLSLSNGDIFFLGQECVLRFTPSAILLSGSDFRVDITSLTVANEHVVWNGQNYIELPYDNRSFEIKFATPTICSPYSLRCRLEGFETEYRDITSDMGVHYTNVSPGRYVLKVGNHDDIIVVVNPPFSATPAGISLVTLVLFLCSVVTALVVIRWEKRRHLKKIAELKEKQERELVSKRMKFMANVLEEIDKPLTMLKATIIQLVKSNADQTLSSPNISAVSEGVEYLEKLSNDITNQIKADEIGYHVEPERVKLVKYNANDSDAEFICKMDKIVEKNLGNETFSVAELERQLGISHATFSRKMSKLVNTTAVEYIKMKRLDAASKILLSTDITVAELSYKVGFSNPSYFVRCFKSRYGVTPIEYIRQNKP